MGTVEVLGRASEQIPIPHSENSAGQLLTYLDGPLSIQGEYSERPLVECGCPSAVLAARHSEEVDETQL